MQNKRAFVIRNERDSSYIANGYFLQTVRNAERSKELAKGIIRYYLKIL